MPRFSETDTVQSWGRVIKPHHTLATPDHRGDVPVVFQTARDRQQSVLGYGLGRSYGDSNLNPDGLLFAGRALDRFISFDRERGVVRAEAGVSLSEILEISVPAGYFLATTPGSRYVTLAGAVANDVHGKNHHRAGCFSDSIIRIGMYRSDEGEITLSRDQNVDLFAATVGGLGMTGIITWVEIQLDPIQSAFIDEEASMFPNVDAFFERVDEATENYEHTVAWIDCTATGSALGRGAFSGGNWSKSGSLECHSNKGPILPVDLPNFTLNPLTLKTFNTLYHARQSIKAKRRLTHYSAFFYPLDTIRGWNRLYGSRGFFQYQSVVPMEGARDATREMLELVSRSGQGSMLAVLKTFGERPSPGLLSFPFKGATLALDFRNAGEKTLRLLKALDEVVTRYGGRLYPAKDGRISPEMFQAGYPEWTKLEEMRDPMISSAFWQRVTGK